MSAGTQIRGFSLRYFLLWMTLVSVACGSLWWAHRLDSNRLFVFSMVCGGLSIILAWIAWQRCWKYASIAMLLLIGSYFGSYAVCSVQGRYECAVAGLDGCKFYAWMPVGFHEEGQWHDRKWNHSVVWFYWPLYLLDRWYWHPTVHGSYTGPLPIERL